MQPPLDRKGRPTLDEPLRPDEEIQYQEQEHGPDLPYVQRVPGEDNPVRRESVTKVTKLEVQRRILVQKALISMAGGERMIDVAEDLGVTVSMLTGWISRHKIRLKQAEIDQRLDQIAVPLATDNLIHGLLAGDKDYTLETLKGRGKLRRFTNADETVHHDLPTLHIQFEPPAAAAGYTPEQIAMGRVVGRAALPVPATSGERLDAAVLAAEFTVEKAMTEKRNDAADRTEEE